MRETEDAAAYLRLSAQRDARVRLRSVVLGIGLLIGVPALMLLPDALPGWVMWACGALAVGLLGKLGTPADKPIVSRAVVPAARRKLTSDTVTRALSVLGIAWINQALRENPTPSGSPRRSSRTAPGWRAEVDLPAGVTAAEVIENRAKLASALGRPLGCVWPEGKRRGPPWTAGAVGGRRGHEQGHAARVAAAQGRHDRPVRAAAVRHATCAATGCRSR